MIVKGNLKVGGALYQFEADEKEDLLAILKVVGIVNIRQECNICNKGTPEDFQFYAYKKSSDKGEFIFVKVRCTCGAVSSLGQYKSGGYYWKDFEEFKSKGGKENQTKSTDDF